MTNIRPLSRMSAALLAGVAAIALGAAAPASAPEGSGVEAAVEDTKPPMPKDFTVTIDQTRMLELPGAVSTISVGNPAIADVNIQGSRLFFTGKSFGRTNVLALSPSGETVIDMLVLVTSQGGGSVTVYKGNKQLTYNCAPNCDRTLMPGDAGEEFNKISDQMSTKTGAAKSGQAE